MNSTMSKDSGSVFSSLATITRTAPDLLEIHFKEGQRWNLPGISELLQLRSEMAQGVPQRVLVVLPGEVDFDLPAMVTGHYDPDTFRTHCKAEAWVVRNAFNEKLVNLYFGYFPSPVPTELFMTEEEARAWLDAY